MVSHNTTLRPIVTVGLLGALVESPPSTRVWVKSVDGIYLYANRDFAADAGGSPVGFSDQDMPWAAYALEYAISDAETISSRVPSVAIREIVPDWRGRRNSVITRKVPLLAPTGEVVGTLGFYELESVGSFQPNSVDCRRCATEVAAAIRASLTASDFQ